LPGLPASCLSAVGFGFLPCIHVPTPPCLISRAHTHDSPTGRFSPCKTFLAPYPFRRFEPSM
jgi:hypothetical protein